MRFVNIEKVIRKRMIESENYKVLEIGGSIEFNSRQSCPWLSGFHLSREGTKVQMDGTAREGQSANAYGKKEQPSDSSSPGSQVLVFRTGRETADSEKHQPAVSREKAPLKQTFIARIKQRTLATNQPGTVRVQLPASSEQAGGSSRGEDATAGVAVPVLPSLIAASMVRVLMRADTHYSISVSLMGDDAVEWRCNIEQVCRIPTSIMC